MNKVFKSRRTWCRGTSRFSNMAEKSILDKVKPMWVRLEQVRSPVKVKTRSYSPHQREFMKYNTEKLIEMDLFEEMPKAA